MMMRMIESSTILIVMTRTVVMKSPSRIAIRGDYVAST
jgi:hypothetical protein